MESISSSSQSRSEPQDLPGYYYDPEQKRYFRQPPSHFAHLPQYSHLPQPTRHSPRFTKPTQVFCEPKTHTGPRSVFEFVTSRQFQTNLQGYPVRTFHESLVCSMSKRETIDCFSPPSSAKAYHDIAMNESGEILAIMYEDEEYDGPIYDRHCVWVHLFELRLDESGALEHEEMMRLLSFVPLHPGRKLDFHTDEEGNELFLRVMPQREDLILCYTFAYGSNRLEFEGGVYNPKTVIRSYNSDICTAVWNTNPQTWSRYTAAIGYSTGAVNIVRPLQRQYTRLFHCMSPRRSSIFSLTFASESPLLFAGCRNGSITAWDLRRRPSSMLTVTEPKHRETHSSIIGLHPLRDDNYLISNAFNSQLSVWDLRMRRSVWRFSGHANTIKSCKSLMDSSESFLAAVGNDAHIRLWSIRSGALLRTIRHEDYMSVMSSQRSQTTLPMICYTDKLGGSCVSNPGLLIAAKNDIAVFKL